MKQYFYSPLLLLLFQVALAKAQSDQDILKMKEHYQQFMGQWGIANDTLTFTINITPWEREFTSDDERKFIVGGFRGRFQCRYTHGDSTLTTTGEIEDWYRHGPYTSGFSKESLNRGVILYKDKITGNTTGGSLYVNGDTLGWSLAGGFGGYTIYDKNGKPDRSPLDKFSIPLKMKLVRIKQ